MQEHPKKYFIWGMGLLGASLGLDLKKHGAEVSGCVRSQSNLDSLKKAGFKHVFLADDPALWPRVQQADGIILGTPVDKIFDIVDEILKHPIKPHCFITDMASTKADLMHWVEAHEKKMLFIGSHPMAGSDLTGPEHARYDLYNNATIYITRSHSQQGRFEPGEYEAAFNTVKDFWHSLGAFPTEVSFETHDKWAAYLSHGLHLVSCMVSHLLNDIPDVYHVASNPAGGSFRDITRVAGSNPALWDSIISTNRLEVQNYLKRLGELNSQWLEKMQNDNFSIQDIFSQAADIRQKIIKENKAGGGSEVAD